MIYADQVRRSRVLAVIALVVATLAPPPASALSQTDIVRGLVMMWHAADACPRKYRINQVQYGATAIRFGIDFEAPRWIEELARQTVPVMAQREAMGDAAFCDHVWKNGGQRSGVMERR